MSTTVRLSFGAQITREDGSVEALADEDLYKVLLPYFAQLAEGRSDAVEPPTLLARATANCHVGPYEDRPLGVDELPAAYRRLDPKEFELITRIPFDFWTNNPYVVDQFPAQRVLVKGVALSKHPDWPKWDKEFAAGEFWSMVGSNWTEVEYLHLKLWSATPGPRLRDEGEWSAQEFREEALVPAIQDAIAKKRTVGVVLDGTAGIGASFLEELFGGLVRNHDLPKDFHHYLQVISAEEPELAEAAAHHIADAILVKERNTPPDRQFTIVEVPRPDALNGLCVGDRLVVESIDYDDKQAWLDGEHGQRYCLDLDGGEEE